MKRIVLCDDVELERQILKELLTLYFEEKGEEISVIEYESGEALITDVEEGCLEAESYEVQASGYLLKPYDVEKIKELTSRLLKDDSKRRVAVKCKRQYRYLYTDDIMHIDTDRHAVTIHMSDGAEIVTQEKLGDLENRIGEARFLRCHQSYLVNMDYIRDAQDDFLLSDGTTVPVRVRGRKEMIDEYHDYFMNHNGQKEE